MKILVTGAAGFVGGHLVKELQSNNHEVIATVNNNENPLPGVLSIAADLMDRGQVKDRIDFSKIDAVVHLAGLAAVGPSFKDPQLYMDVNTGIERNLYEACVAQDARPKFLIISSGTLYDPASKMPITEDSPVKSTSPYADSKIAQEDIAKEYTNDGFDYIIARPFNHIGPGQNLGFIVPDFAKQIVAGERGEITEIQVGNLDAKRDFTDVRDIVRAYRMLIESNSKNDVFVICSGNSVSGQEILNMLLTRSMARLAITQDPTRMRPSDIAEIYGDHSKLTQATGWLPSYSLDQTIDNVLDDWRSRE